ncbi:hypothetical protein [Streptomyces sp. NBC_01092]|uniref:hypothetical protein n=1 Tax=Streptomyces sp. NBC_01092 TaxID=2903748 RepID=UPI00386ACE96|nr:hypothetical protein OG254_09090 [Streptomyces sp. NBC_01092]
MSMQQYGLTPYQESESYPQELEFGAEAHGPGEYEGPLHGEYEMPGAGEYEIAGAEAEFGGHAEGAFGGHGEAGAFGSHAESWEVQGGLHEGPAYGEVPHAELESPLSEQQEIQLAAELLEITTEAEFEQFIGGLIKNARNFFRKGFGKTLGGLLKNFGPALAGLLPVPGLATVANLASKLFEVQSEGVDRQEFEFEIARRFVRLASTAVQNAALDQRPVSPEQQARDALLTAAQIHAPGLARYPQLIARPASWHWPAQQAPGFADGHGQPRRRPGRARSGRWVRYNNSIVILGL